MDDSSSDSSRNAEDEHLVNETEQESTQSTTQQPAPTGRSSFENEGKPPSKQQLSLAKLEAESEGGVKTSEGENYPGAPDELMARTTAAQGAAKEDPTARTEEEAPEPEESAELSAKDNTKKNPAVKSRREARKKEEMNQLIDKLATFGERDLQSRSNAEDAVAPIPSRALPDEPTSQKNYGKCRSQVYCPGWCDYESGVSIYWRGEE
jgi:hypothetical protein